MKKFATLLLTAGLLCSNVTGAHAIDFKAKGEWIMSFDYGAGDKGASATKVESVYGYQGSDNFGARQRVRLQLEAIASETLSATVFFEMGDSPWGNRYSGGALGADATIIELKHAYIDWVIPSTELKVRMGIQGIALPSYTTDGSMVFNNDVAGIVLSNKFNDNISLTFFWARPYNDNYTNELTSNANVSSDHVGFTDSSNYLDNTDMFGLMLPMRYEGFAITPWLTYAAVGRNTYRHGKNANGITAYFNPISTDNFEVESLVPFEGNAVLSQSDLFEHSNLKAYADVWNLGITGEITAIDSLRLAWDINYGYSYFGEVSIRESVIKSVLNSHKKLRDFQVRREGFYVSLLAEYTTNFGIPGVYGWYASGDDDDPYNGSESMPSFGSSNSHIGFSNFASSGNPYIARESVLGRSLVGTWGIGVRLKDFSFFEDLTHTLRVNYINGTNSTAMARYIKLTLADAALTSYSATGNNLYLTTNDRAWEFGLSTNYEIYENLNMYIEAAYLALSFDQSNDAWGQEFTLTDAYNINVTFAYTF